MTSNWNKFFFLLITLFLSCSIARDLEEDAYDGLDNSEATPIPSESPSSHLIEFRLSFKDIYKNTKDTRDAFFGLKNTDNAFVYGPYLIDDSSFDLQVKQGYYTLWFEGAGFDRFCSNSDPYSGDCFRGSLLQVTVTYFDDKFLIYNGPVQQSVPLDIDFFITPLEEGVQTVKFLKPSESSGQYLSYHFDDSAFETITSLPKGINSNYVLRYVFNVTSSLQYEGMEVRLRSGTGVRLWLNDVVVYNDPWNRVIDNRTWCQFLVPGSFLVEGRNVLSFRMMKSSNLYPVGFDCKARLLRSTFSSDRWEKPSMDRGVELFEASKLKPYSFNTQQGSKTISYSYNSYTVETLTQFCIVADQLSSIPPRFQLISDKYSSQILASFTTENYTLVIDRPDDNHVYCYNLEQPVIASSFSWAFLSSNTNKTYTIMGLIHNGHRLLYEEEDRYPVTTFNRVTTRTCVSPNSIESVPVFSLFSADYEAVDDSLGVTLDSRSGELCVDISNAGPVELNVGVFGALGYRYVPISIIRSTRDCIVNSTNLIHETERLEDGECGFGYLGLVYRVCEDGALRRDRSECVRIPPLPFSYAVSPFYYLSEELSLSPNITNVADSYAVQPSLPAGLTLNSTTGIIAGSPSGPNGTYPLTVTATNEAGTAETSFTLTLLHYPCNYNGASIPSGDRVYTRDCVGGAGRVYLVCFNSVLSAEHLDECTKPSSFSYSITSFLAESKELTLTPVFSNSNVGVGFVIQPLLPSGLNLNPTTGVISGSSDASGIFLLTITATNEGGSTVTSFTLALSASLVVPEADIFLVVYGCPAGYSGSRLLFSKEFNSNLTGGCSFMFTDSFLYETEPLYTLFAPMRVELSHAEVFDEFSIDPALPTSVSFDNATGVIEGVWKEPDNRTFTVSAMSSIDVQTVTLSLSFEYPPCEGQNGVEVSYGEEQTVKCFGWSVLGSRNQKCVAGEDGVLLEDLPNHCVELHAGVFGAVLLVCVVIIIVVVMIVSLHPKVKVTIGEVYV